MEKNDKLILITAAVLVIGAISILAINSNSKKEKVLGKPVEVHKDIEITERDTSKNNKEEKEDIDEKVVSIDFSSTEIKNGDVFETFDPAEYKDKNIIITFSNSECPYCDQQATEFENMRDDFDFESFYIPAKESDLATSSTLDELGVTDYKIIIDRENKLLEDLGITSIPTNLIKRKGEEDFKIVVGVIRDKPSDEDKVDRLLKDYID